MAVIGLEAWQRIAKAEAAGLCRAAAFLAGLFPEIPIRVARPHGSCLFAMGPDHLVNRVTGLGLDGPVETSTMDEIERTFEELGVAGEVELWPHAEPALQAILEVRGYRRSGGWRVLAAALETAGAEDAGARPASGIEIETVTAGDAGRYERTLALGFMDLDDGEPGLAQVVFARAAAVNPRTVALLATIDGEPAGGGAMSTHRGVAALYGASTLPRFRGRGVQSALLRRRLAIAREAGCDLAYIKTTPETGSERNARRAGFGTVVDTALWKRERVRDEAT